MPYVRMTVTISAAYHVTNTNMSAEEMCVHQEQEMRDSLAEAKDGLADTLRRLLAFAKGPGGTITWTCRPEKVIVPDIPKDPS